MYKNTGNAYQNALTQKERAQATFGKSTKANQTTEYEPGKPSGAEYIGKAMGLMSIPGQFENALDNLDKGAQWLANLGGAPDTKSEVVKAGTGAVDLTGGAQMNSGAQIGAQELQNAFYKTPAQETEQLASEAAAQAVNPANVAEGAQTATQAATQASQGGLSTMGATLAPAAGGVVGGLAGKELGRAIGGDTGATIGGLAGSMGGAYLGGMAAGSLAGGAAAGAAAGSAVPGMGTVIGAGIGALSSFFL